VQLVGGGALQFQQDAAGLKIQVPDRRPSEYTAAFQIA